MLFALHYMSKDDLFVDIGANIGIYTILIAGVKQSKVVALEPMEKNYEILMQNINYNNLSNIVTPMNLAIGREDIKMQFNYDGALSKPTFEKSSAELVSVKKLDMIIDYAELIKIDVEGYESDVLKGSISVLEDIRTNALIIEMIPNEPHEDYKHDVYRVLQYYGFNAYQYNPTKRDFEYLSSNKISIPNTIFIRNLDLAKIKVMESPSFKIGSNFY